MPALAELRAAGPFEVPVPGGPAAPRKTCWRAPIRAPSDDALVAGAGGFRPLRYLAELTTPRLVLWCYLIWYLCVLGRYFDPSPRLWLTSLGIAVIIGTALYLSTARAGRTPTRLEPWQIARFYLMPFCVSSFAALVKGRDFILVFYPELADNVRAVTACAGFVAVSSIARLLR